MSFNRFIFALLLVAAVSLCAAAQVPLNVITVNVEDLPSASLNNGKTFQVNSPTRGDCSTTGGGSAVSWCKSKGGVWVPVGDGGTGASGSVNSVNATPPLSSTGGSDPIISLNDTSVTPGSYTYGGFTVDAKGRLTSASSGATPEVPLTFSTGLTRTTNTITVNTSQNIAKLSNLTSNGFVKTGSSDGTLSVDTGSYVPTSRNINTTSPITGGGDLSADRTVGCATCVVAFSPGAGVAHFAGGTQTVTSSLIVNADITNSTIDLTAKVTGILPAANGGTGMNNAGKLGSNADATISGGGTFNLNGFTFTVPGTGTGVLTARILTSGAGLTGGGDLSADRTLAVGAGAGITVNADDVALTTPGSLSVATTNNSTGNHTHAITSSPNPGAAAVILATDASGYLTTVRHTVSDYLFVNASTANLYLKNTSTGFRSATTLIVTPQANNSIQSSSYTSGLTGWSWNALGDIEANNILARGEFRASTFKYNEVLSTAGTLGVFYSASSLYADTTIPGGFGASFTFDARNTDEGFPLFTTGWVVRFKSLVNSGGVIIGDSWATITGRVDHTTYSTYSATFNAGTPGVTFRAGTGIPAYGPSGSGYITLSADGTVGASPNLTMATHSGAPWGGVTPLSRLGNLNGSYGYAVDVHGWAAGQYGVSGQPWISIETTNGIRIGNNTTVLGQWDTSGNILVGQTGSGQSNIQITSGAINLRNNTTTLIQLSSSGTALFGQTGSGNSNVLISAGSVKFRNNTTDIITLDTSEARFDNLIKMSGASAAIAIGSTPPTSASAGTGVWLDRTGIYGLLSNVVQAKLDAATGALIAGGGRITLNSGGAVQFGYSAPDTGLLGSTNEGKTLLLSSGRAHSVNGVLKLEVERAASGGDDYSTGAMVLQTTSAGAWDIRLYSGAVELPPDVGNPPTGNQESSLAGMTVGANSAPAAMLDVRGSIVATGSLGTTGARLVKGWFADLQVTNSIAGSITGNSATATALATARTIAGQSFNGTANINIASSDLSNGSNVALLNAVQTFSANQTIGGGGAGIPLTILSGSGAGSIDIRGRSGDHLGYLQFFNNNGTTIQGGMHGGNGYVALFGTGADVIKIVTGVQIGAPTGGDKGTGTINLAGDIYKNNGAYTNPDFVFERAYNGKIERFAGNEGAAEYRGLMPLSEVEAFTRKNLHLPGFGPHANLGLFSGGDRLLMRVEDAYLYLFEMERTINQLKARISALEGGYK